MNKIKLELFCSMITHHIKFTFSDVVCWALDFLSGLGFDYSLQ